MNRYEKLITGLQILNEYEKTRKVIHGTSAEHDVIFAGPPSRDLPVEINNKMKELGWINQEDFEGVWGFYT